MVKVRMVLWAEWVWDVESCVVCELGGGRRWRMLGVGRLFREFNESYMC